MGIDYYEVLQVSRTADSVVIDKAYRALSMKYHPDTSVETEHVAHRRMQRINEAYHVLRDPVKRASYDATLPAMVEVRSGWDVFWDEGLVGLYLRRSHRKR